MKRHKARFISIEGIEGVGKTTIRNFLCNLFDQQGINYTFTREPGGTPIAEAIRHILLGHYDETMSVDTEVLLMFAGRAQNIKQIILPALEKEQWVLCDRFTDSSFAYQGGGRGFSIQNIKKLAEWVQGDLQPDLTLLLDTPVEIGLSRVTSRDGGAKDRIESEGMDFFKRVRNTYLKLARQYPRRFHIIKANQGIAMIERDVEKALQPLLKSSFIKL